MEHVKLPPHPRWTSINRIASITHGTLTVGVTSGGFMLPASIREWVDLELFDDVLTPHDYYAMGVFKTTTTKTRRSSDLVGIGFTPSNTSPVLHMNMKRVGSFSYRPPMIYLWKRPDV